MNVIEQFIDDVGIDVLKRTNIKLLGLTKQPWNFSRGAKTTRQYIDDNELINVEVTYTYSWTEGGRKVDDFQRLIKFYDSLGTVILELPIKEPLSIKDKAAVNRDIRQGQLDYLEQAASDMRGTALSLPQSVDAPTLTYLLASGQFPRSVYNLETYLIFRERLIKIADSIEFIFEFYDTEITQYISRGTSLFEDHVRTADDDKMIDILSLLAPPTADFPDGITIKQAILYQLTGSPV